MVKKVLTFIAKGNSHQLTGQKAIQTIAMSGSAISKTVQFLEENDYIEKLADEGYRITDPLVRDVLAYYESI